MFYLTDIAYFGLVLLGLGLLSGCFWSDRRSTIENLLVPSMLFFGGYALCVWLTGTLWKLVPVFFCLAPWPPLLALIVWRRRRIPGAFRDILTAFRGLSLEQGILLGYVGIAAAITFVLTLAPPNGADYDSLVYHLAAPAQYLRHGRIIELPTDHHSYFPFTLETWFLLGLAAKGPVLAKLFHWLMLPVGALALLSMGSRTGYRSAGFWAAALYASMPLILAEAMTAYIDLGFTAFSLLAALALLRALEEEDELHWLMVSGAFCGFSLGSKYFGALIFGFLGLWLLGTQIQRRRVRLAHLLTFAVPAILLGSPWYVRNWLWTGNPVYPFAYGLFGGTHWTKAMAEAYYADQKQFGFGHTLLDNLWAAWRLAMAPFNLNAPFWPLRSDIQAASGTKGGFDVSGMALSSFIGPAWLAAGMPAFFLRSKPRPVLLALVFFGLLWIFWLISSQQVRYLMPGLALLCIAGGWSLCCYAESFPLARRVASVTLGLWFVAALVIAGVQGMRAWPVVSGHVNPEQYLLRTAPGYDVMMLANTQTPKDAVFAVYGEPRCFYLNRNYFLADSAHSTVLPYDQIHTGAQLVSALKKENATYALWNPKALFGSPTQWTLWQEAVSDGLAVLRYESGDYQLYEIH